MRVTIAAEEDGKRIISATLTFSDKEEGLGVVHMLERFARNRWQSSEDERGKKALGEKVSTAPANPIA